MVAVVIAACCGGGGPGSIVSGGRLVCSCCWSKLGRGMAYGCICGVQQWAQVVKPELQDFNMRDTKERDGQLNTQGDTTCFFGLSNGFKRMVIIRYQCVPTMGCGSTCVEPSQ